MSIDNYFWAPTGALYGALIVVNSFHPLPAHLQGTSGHLSVKARMNWSRAARETA